MPGATWPVWAASASQPTAWAGSRAGAGPRCGRGGGNRRGRGCRRRVRRRPSRRPSRRRARGRRRGSRGRPTPKWVGRRPGRRGPGGCRSGRRAGCGLAGGRARRGRRRGGHGRRPRPRPAGPARRRRTRRTGRPRSTAADAGHGQVEAVLGLQDLSAGLVADDPLELADHERVGIGPTASRWRSGSSRLDPVPQEDLVDGVLQGRGAGGHRPHFQCGKRPHADDVEVLAPGVSPM